jgi:hypothetical protein
MLSSPYTVRDEARLTGGDMPSFTLTVKLKDPGELGFPLRTPAGLSARPAGGAPGELDQV